VTAPRSNCRAASRRDCGACPASRTCSRGRRDRHATACYSTPVDSAAATHRRPPTTLERTLRLFYAASLARRNGVLWFPLTRRNHQKISTLMIASGRIATRCALQIAVSMSIAGMLLCVPQQCPFSWVYSSPHIMQCFCGVSETPSNTWFLWDIRDHI